MKKEYRRQETEERRKTGKKKACMGLQNSVFCLLYSSL